MSAETRFIRVGNLRVRVNESVTNSGDLSKPAVVFFHGFSFSTDDWDRIGTLKLVREHGFQVVALDLPSGSASKSDKMEIKEISDYNPILEQVFLQLGIPKNKKLVIIGPSMGGAFALSYALEHPEQVSGLVLIAPSIHRVPETSIRSLKHDIPMLLVWGDRDDVFPLDEYAKPLQKLFPKSKLVTLKGASHPAYLDMPEEFHRLLLNFLEETRPISD